MPFITIFTAPKPFTNPHINTIQRNALRSWLQRRTEVEVVVIGEEEGLAETAAELGILHLPNVERNAQGTPLVSSIFALACAATDSPLMAYLNADILLLPGFAQAARLVHEQADEFLAVGQRWDLDITRPREFTPGWEDRLQADLERSGRLHRPQGSDYFIFPRGLFADMPHFAIGRAGWDNWMIYHARQQDWPVVDLTPSVQVVHQNHDYSHLPGGRPHYDLEESDQNMRMAGGWHHMYPLLDTNRELREGQIVKPRPSFLRLLRWTEVWLTPPDGRKEGLRWSLARQFRRRRRRLTGSLT